MTAALIIGGIIALILLYAIFAEREQNKLLTEEELKPAKIPESVKTGKPVYTKEYVERQLASAKDKEKLVEIKKPAKKPTARKPRVKKPIKKEE